MPDFNLEHNKRERRRRRETDRERTLDSVVCLLLLFPCASSAPDWPFSFVPFLPPFLPFRVTAFVPLSLIPLE
jgi:hypothetical protein